MQLEFYYIEWYYLPLLWPHRLTVRTPGSHPGNRVKIACGNLQGNLLLKTCFQK